MKQVIGGDFHVTNISRLDLLLVQVRVRRWNAARGATLFVRAESAIRLVVGRGIDAINAIKLPTTDLR